MLFPGQFSVKLSNQNPYGFTNIIYNAKKGDLIKVSVWRLGKSGSIVYSEFKNGGVYDCVLKKSLKKKIQGGVISGAEFFVPNNLPGAELRIYVLFNNGFKDSGLTLMILNFRIIQENKYLSIL